MFRVYHMNHFVNTFATREDAISFIMEQTGGGMGDYEVLDNSDV